MSIITGTIEEIANQLSFPKDKNEFPVLGYKEYLEINKRIYEKINEKYRTNHAKTKSDKYLKENIDARLYAYERSLKYEEGSYDSNRKIVFCYASTTYAFNKINYAIRSNIISRIASNINNYKTRPIIILEDCLEHDISESRIYLDNLHWINAKDKNLETSLRKLKIDYLSRFQNNIEVKVNIENTFEFLKELAKEYIHEGNYKEIKKFFRQASIDTIIRSCPNIEIVIYNNLYKSQSRKFIDILFSSSFLLNLERLGIINKNELPIDILNASCCNSTHIGPFFSDSTNLTYECNKIKREVSFLTDNFLFRPKKALLNPLIFEIYGAIPLLSLRDNTELISQLGTTVIGINNLTLVNGTNYTQSIDLSKLNLDPITDYDTTMPLIISERKPNKEEFVPISSIKLKTNIISLIKEREKVRKYKQFNIADLLREKLLEQGIEIRDTLSESYIRKC